MEEKRKKRKRIEEKKKSKNVYEIDERSKIKRN